MKNRRIIDSAILAFALAGIGFSAQAAEPLKIKVLTAAETSFGVNATLVTGEKEAMVIGAGFTRSDALHIAAAVLDSGKTLKTILISDADPDYYFGAEVLKAMFPAAEVVAPQPVVDEIKDHLDGKLKVWGPKLGDNAPKQPVIPKVLTTTVLSVDGQKVEIRGTTGELANRPYVWIPSARTVTGNVALWSNLHVWTANTQTAAQRQAWLDQLDEIQALKPAVVVPGHMKIGDTLDESSINFTRKYLNDFIAAIPQAHDSRALFGALQKQYPDAGLTIALDIGAKVAKGEMKW
jgi:glyoxylase-like metal-dependent hydrolase (beta-lactamase superfamily II)